MQVEQNGSHAEAHQAQGSWISQLSVAHSSSKIRQKMIICRRHTTAKGQRGAAS
jgi:hypothetical protein